MSPDGPEPSPARSPSEPRLPPAGHLLRTYRGEAFPWRSVVSFLMAGLADDRRLLYLHDQGDRRTLEDRLRGADVDVDQLTASGQLHVQAAEEHYLRDGTLEPDHLVQALRSALVVAIRDGYDGLQVVGEVGRASVRDVSPEALIRYERRVGEVVGPELVEALCLYPSDELDDALLDELKEVHEEHFPHVESGGGRTGIGVGQHRSR